MQAENLDDLDFAVRYDPAMTEGTEWQARAKAVGLSQRTLATLVGLTENGVSQGIRGKWPSGIPQSIKFAVIAWEVMTPDQRAEVARLMAGK